MRAPMEEYKKCPHCGKNLGLRAVAKRLQRKAVQCTRCKELIMPDRRVY